MSDIRVLVFGSTGTGKTSVCNELSGFERPVSSSARGVTFESYNYNPFKYQGHNIILTDTVGLNEASSGTVSPSVSVTNMIELLKNSINGYNLLIHVMRAPRITETFIKNHELFVNTYTDNKIPVILVVTGCENEDPMQNWVVNNESEFIKDGLNYKKIIATGFAKGGRAEPIYKQVRNESKKIVLEGVMENALPDAIRVFSNVSEFHLKLKKIWNALCGFTNMQELRLGVNENARDLLKKLKVSPEIRNMLTQELSIFTEKIMPILGKKLASFF